MNITTVNYEDGIDGENLACAPGNVAEGLEAICALMPWVGVGNLLNAVMLFFLAYWKWHYNRLDLPRRTLRIPGGAPAQSMNNGRTQQGIQPTSRFVEKVLLASGVTAFFAGTTFLTHSFGTKYPTTHIWGQIGDLSMTLLFASAWYVTFLQNEGANQFKLLIQGPRGGHKSSRLLSIPSALDAAKGWLAPIFALGLLGLMYAGVYHRGWLIFNLGLVYLLCGLRSFVAIVRKRLGTLRRIVTVANAKSGTPEEMRRRRKVIGSKFLTLVVDVSMVFLISLLLPSSFIVFGSAFNSRTLAVNAVIMYIPIVIGMGLANVRLYSVFRARKKRKIIQLSTAMKGNSVAPSSGMSVTGSSCVNGSEV